MKRLLFFAVAALALSATAEDPYIESLGTSGISTGYRMKGGISRVEVDFALTTTENSAQTWVFGTDNYENTLRTMFYFTGSGVVGSSFMFRVRGGDNINVGAADSDLTTKTGDRGWNHAADTDRHVLIIDLKNGLDQIKTGETLSLNQSFNANLLTDLMADLPLSLFGRYANGCATAFDKFCKAKMYGVKIYENDVLVHDFVPCLKDGETPCFKDLVGGGFIIGEDVAAFAASGNAPTYQDDAYVSTVSGEGSKMSIDTGVKVTDNTRIELDCAIATNMVGDVEWHIFDCNCSPRFIMSYAASAMRYVAGGLAPASAAKVDTSAFPHPTDKKDVRRTLILDNYGGVVAVETSGFTNKTVTFTHPTTTTSTGNIVLGAYHGGANFNTPLKIYGCKIYESGVLVRDFAPFIKFNYVTGTATPGLLDSMTGAFVSGRDGSNGGNLLAYGGTIKGEQDAYIESNGSTGMSSGYKMKGNISRVEVEYSLTDANANSTRIFGDTSIEKTVKTMFYFTGSAGQTGGVYTYRISAKSGSAHDVQYHSGGVSTIPMDTARRTLVTDLKSGKCQVNEGATVNSRNVSNSGTFASDFNGLVADLPLSLFANYSNAAGTTYANSSKARIYSVRFYENYVEGGNNTPVRELIPYSRGGVVGFYDTVTGEIVKNDNASAGAFTFGGAGTDHGALNCYLKLGYATNLAYRATTKLTAYAPGAVSYRWYRDGQLIDDDDDGVADGADGELSVEWRRDGEKTADGLFSRHGYQATAVFSMYGATRESEPTVPVEIKSRRIGVTLLVK